MALPMHCFFTMYLATYSYVAMWLVIAILEGFVDIKFYKKWNILGRFNGWITTSEAH